jgi:predicted acylesterase/phospholipase RssA
MEEIHIVSETKSESISENQNDHITEVKHEHNSEVKHEHNSEVKHEHNSEVRLEQNSEVKQEHDEFRLEQNSEVRFEHNEHNYEVKQEHKTESENNPEQGIKHKAEIEVIYHDYDTIVLAGGSAKSIVTLGALQYVYDNFLHRDLKYYIGTSAGAILCYLLIIGYTPIEIIVYICTHQILEKMQNFNVFSLVQGRGASSFNVIQEQLEKMTISKIGYLPTLKDLKSNFHKELVCTTYDLTESKTVFLNHKNHPHLPCITALRMTSNLPLIFENYKYGNSFYIDGGISDNFPIDYADKVGNKILGINLIQEIKEFEPSMNTLEFIYKIMFIPIQQSVKHKISKASNKCKIIQLQYDKLKFFDFNVKSQMKMEMFSSGYQQISDEI